MSTADVRTGTASPWAAHRSRAEELRERHRHAAQMLTLYLALLDVWEEAWRAAKADPPPPGGLAGWAAERVFPAVVTATARFGPAPLAEAVRAQGAVAPVLAGWLEGAGTAPVEQYVARAVLRGPLEALDAAAALGGVAGGTAARAGAWCPRCGGAPQLSVRASADDPLVSGRRHLTCARCGHSWAYSGSTCPACGETTGARRTVYTEHRGGPVVGRRGDADDPAPADPPLFPHLRIDSCTTCSRYLIEVDLSLDHRAVPEVDELAAVPLDLFATERGLTKIAPNLMGF